MRMSCSCRSGVADCSQGESLSVYVSNNDEGVFQDSIIFSSD